MKRLLAAGCLAALVSATALAQVSNDLPGKFRRWTAAQATTEAAPTLVTEGMSLSGIAGYRVSICAAVGQTLSGAGTLQAYAWDNDLALWVRDNDLDLTVDQSAARCQVFPDVVNVVDSGRVFYAATSVTVSASTVTVAIKARVGGR